MMGENGKNGSEKAPLGLTKFKTPRKPYTKRPPEFWEQLANEYIEGGISMAVLAEKHGVSPVLLRYYVDGIFKSGTLERRKAYLAKAKEVGETLAVTTKEKAEAWVEEEVNRCYTFRDKIEECLVQTDNPKEVAYLSSAEERIDKVARRSMGLEDKMELNANFNVHGLVEIATKIFEKKAAEGEVPVIDVDFELEDSSTSPPI